MTLTCKWIKDETGALVMKWTGDDDEFSTAKPRMRKITELTAIFTNNHGNNEAVATFKSNSPTDPVTLWRAHEVSEDSISLSRLNRTSISIAASSCVLPPALRFTPVSCLTLGGFDDHPHPHPTGRRARLLPEPSRRLLAGHTGAAADDPQTTSCVVRRRCTARRRTAHELTRASTAAPGKPGELDLPESRTLVSLQPYQGQ
jgi:hypothetical protein